MVGLVDVATSRLLGRRRRRRRYMMIDLCVCVCVLRKRDERDSIDGKIFPFAPLGSLDDINIYMNQLIWRSGAQRV